MAVLHADRMETRRENGGYRAGEHSKYGLTQQPTGLIAAMGCQCARFRTAQASGDFPDGDMVSDVPASNNSK